MNGSDRTAQRDELERAIMRAMIDATIVEAGGTRRAVLDSGEAVDAMLTLIASLSATSDATALPRGRREFCDRIAKALGQRIVAFQAHHAVHGTPFQIIREHEGATC